MFTVFSIGLLVAEAKQREAIAKVKEADDLERLVRKVKVSMTKKIRFHVLQEADGTRNLARLCDQLLVQGRLR